MEHPRWRPREVAPDGRCRPSKETRVLDAACPRVGFSAVSPREKQDAATGTCTSCSGRPRSNTVSYRRRRCRTSAAPPACSAAGCPWPPATASRAVHARHALGTRVLDLQARIELEEEVVVRSPRCTSTRRCPRPRTRCSGRGAWLSTPCPRRRPAARCLRKVCGAPPRRSSGSGFASSSRAR